MFHEKVCILRKFCAKIALKRRALHDVIMLLLMTSLAKERETAVKSVCNVCHIGKFMKWLYERENHVINIFTQFKFTLRPEGKIGKNKTGVKFTLYTVYYKFEERANSNRPRIFMLWFNLQALPVPSLYLVIHIPTKSSLCGTAHRTSFLDPPIIPPH